MGNTNVGRPVTTIVIRNGKEETVEVTIGELPSEEDIKLAVNSSGAANIAHLGLSITDLDEKKRETLGIVEGGVLVRDVEAGPARDAGIRKNDVIMMVDDIDIENVRHFKKIIDEKIDEENAKTVRILVYQGGSPRSPLFIALKISAK